MLKYLLLLLLSINALAQEPAFTFAPGSDVQSYSFIQDQNKRLGYDAIEDDSGDYSFRISNHNLTVTVYKLDTISFGNIAFGIHEIDDITGTYGAKDFIMQFTLTPQEAKSVVKLINDTQIDTIPTDKNIFAWRFGFDGTIYTLQHKKDGIYSLKNYWTPSSQRDVPEAEKINYFTTHLFSILELSNRREIFERYIPFRSWTNGSYIAVRALRTREEYRDYKRRKRQYEKSQK